MQDAPSASEGGRRVYQMMTVGCKYGKIVKRNKSPIKLKLDSLNWSMT